MAAVTRRIVIVAYPGVQALDVAGPYEVFVSASRVVTAEGTNGVPDAYTVELVSPSGAMVSTESGLPLGTAPLPHPPGPIDTLVLPGGTGSRAARYDAALIDVGPRRGSHVAAHRHGVLGRVPGRRGRPGRRAHDDHALGTSAAIGRRLPRHPRRSRPDLRARRSAVEQRWRDRRHRPVTRARRGRPRHRGGPDRRPLAGDVPAPARRPDAVRRTGVDAARRAVGDPHRAGRDRGPTRRRPQRSRARRCAPR